MNSHLKVLSVAIIGLQLTFPVTVFAGDWFKARNGAEVRITYGDFSHGRDPNGPGYENYAPAVYTPPVPKRPVDVIYSINSEGKITQVKSGVRSNPLVGGIENANIFPNNIAWEPSSELLKTYVRDYLVPSLGFNTSSSEARKAVENVMEYSIPTLEVMDESNLATNLVKKGIITSQQMQQYMSMILVDPVVVLVLAAEHSIAKLPSYQVTEIERENVKKFAAQLDSNRNAKWMSFLREHIIPKVAEHVKRDSSWRFDHLRSPIYSLYTSAYAETFAKMPPVGFSGRSCSIKLGGLKLGR